MNCFTITVRYSNGTFETRGFSSRADAEWFIHNEGDHVIGSHISPPYEEDKDDLLPKKGQRWPY